MNIQDIARHRLYNQQIAAQEFKRPDAVVSWLGAVQAQDLAGAKWSIGLRVADAMLADIDNAIASRSIIRTWPMRGTLHFVAAADVRWMTAHLTPRIIAGSAGRMRELELDEATFSRCRKILVRALQGGGQLTRDAMYKRLEASRISAAGQRGMHILCRLSQEGLICLATPEGNQQTFALLEEWVPAAKQIDREEALAILAGRYFTSHGPATLLDFAGWAGLKMSDARAAVDAIASSLVSEDIDGRIFSMSRDMSDVRKTSAAAAWLLPGFDEYMLGYKDRSAALDPAHAQKICPGSNGMFMSTVVTGNRVTGTWKRTIKKNVVIITPTPFNSWSAAQKSALAKPARHYGKFIGLPAVL